MGSIKQFSVGIDEKLERRLKRASKARNTTLSKLCRELLKEGVDRIEGKVEAALSREEGERIMEVVERLEDTERVINRDLVERMCHAVLSSEQILFFTYHPDKETSMDDDKIRELRKIGDQSISKTNKLLPKKAPEKTS